jgi:uncharacterized protein (DUF1015 family)
MAIVKPFRGLRPKPKFCKEIASPPYDVLSTEEARKIVKQNPKSFLRINKAELEFSDDMNPYSEAVYQRGKANLQQLIDNGLMIRDENPCFYVYRLTMDNRSQTGLVSLVSVDDYNNGLIKKHEHTRPEKVNDRADHINFLDAQVGPVFTAYRFQEPIQRIFNTVTENTPSVDFVEDDTVRHEFWVIDDPDLQKGIISEFASFPLYIADGHHRSQSASEVCRRKKEQNPHHTGEEGYNYFLNVIFSDSELTILPYNRVVRDMNGLTISEILKKTAHNFKISSVDGAVNPEELHTFGMYVEGNWFLLKAREGSFDPNDPTGSIDATILGDNFIAPILGIKDPKTDKRINFIGGIRGTKELIRLVNSGEYKLAFSLFPTSIKQLLDVADSGEVMPPKSTWFEPKLRSGMIVNMLTD